MLQRRRYIFHHPLLRMVLLLRKAARGGGIAATSKCFVPFRHDQRALRSPFGNLRPITPQTMWYPTLAGRGGSVSRRDRDRAHRRHAQLAGGTNDEERINSNASCFPEGSAREGPFSERPPPSQYAKPWQVAAALSAAVTATELVGDTPNLQAEPTMKRGSTQTPVAFRKGARGRGLSQKGRLPRSMPKPWQVAAALSAAVTATELIGDTPNLQAEPTMKRGSTQTPAAFRKGARGRGLSQKGRLPRSMPNVGRSRRLCQPP